MVTFSIVSELAGNERPKIWILLHSVTCDKVDILII